MMAGRDSCLAPVVNKPSSAAPQPALFEASVPVCQRYLGALSGWLERADPDRLPELLGQCLTSDMLPLQAQVEIACNFALRLCFPLAGREVPDYGCFAPTPAGLQARLAHVQSLLACLNPADFEAPPDWIEDRAGQALLRLPPDDFLHLYALPNFFFHCSMAYALLRLHGVPLGKPQFDGFHIYPD